MTGQAIRQCNIVRARQSFAMQDGGKGRRTHVMAGDRFWVTSTALDAQVNDRIEVAREGRTRRYRFNVATFWQCFEKV